MNRGRMSQHSLVRRVVAGFYLLLGITLWGAVPVAEARAEAASSPVAHVEEPGQRCAPIHDHGDCNLCRTLRIIARGDAAPAFESGSTSLAERPAEPDDAFALICLVEAQRPRAPPAI